MTIDIIVKGLKEHTLFNKGDSLCQIRDNRDALIAKLWAIETQSYPPELVVDQISLFLRSDEGRYGFNAPEDSGKMHDWLDFDPIRFAEIKVGVYPVIIGGFATGAPTYFDWDNATCMQEKLYEYRKHDYMRYFSNFDGTNRPAPNTWYTTSTAVPWYHWGKGIGTALVKDSLEQAASLGLQKRASVLRLFGYQGEADDLRHMTDYVESLKERDAADPRTDPRLRMYLKLGAQLMFPLPNYEEDKECKNAGVLAVFDISSK